MGHVQGRMKCKRVAHLSSHQHVRRHRTSARAIRCGITLWSLNPIPVSHCPHSMLECLDEFQRQNHTGTYSKVHVVFEAMVPKLWDILHYCRSQPVCTGNLFKAVPRFGELCSCCCLPLLPQLACNILATWERPYRDSLYTPESWLNHSPSDVVSAFCGLRSCYPRPASTDVVHITSLSFHHNNPPVHLHYQ